MLKVHNLRKRFGGVKAVDIDDISFEQNQLTSIIGPNGAGKTTFFDLISGFTEGDEGKVFLNEKNITNSQPFSIARQGMVRTFQLTKVFDRMTVIENMMFSGSNTKNDSLFRSLMKLSTQKNNENLIREKAFEIMKDLKVRKKTTEEEAYKHELNTLRAQIDVVDQTLLDTLGKRMMVAKQIGNLKLTNNVAVLQNNRWNEILNNEIKDPVNVHTLSLIHI